MADKIDWKSLSHKERINLLASRSDDQIASKYRVAGKSVDDFRQLLVQDRALWIPENVGDFKPAGKPPTKHSLLGSYRDLERSEALLELIDNSIDVWLARRVAHPKAVAEELNIVITIEDKLGLLRYEDNAGGVPEDKLDQLVVPGYSDTTDLSETIGSYKTGGKKAIFRLATAAQILTRHWDPEGKTDKALSVQLDEQWLSDPDLYEFKYATVTDKQVIEKGSTEYVLRLHEEPVGGVQWYDQPDLDAEVRTQIRETYGLLLIRNPKIHIFYRNRAQAIQPQPELLYDFSGANDSETDIRPQQVIFQTKLVHQGVQHPIEIEVILGSRRGVGAGKHGLDLYGNNRLFVACDEDLLLNHMPTGQAARFFRGLINIKGPNVFIPWDTHKRHLNVDRDITRFITTNPLIVKVFENWFAIYKKISRGGRGEVKSRIDVELERSIDQKRNDLFIPHRGKVALDPSRKRGNLPKEVFVPNAAVTTKASDSVDISLHFTRAEAEEVKRYYAIPGNVSDRSTKIEIAAHIQTDVLKRAGRKKSK